MTLRHKLMATIVFSACATLPVLLLADVNGADPGLTGAPGDQNCTSCHSGTSLNSSNGKVEIILAGGNTYTPGTTQHVQVKVSDSSQKRWGFELTARAASSPSSTQAGSFTTSNSNAKVICANGRSTPCTSTSMIQFATHTQAGTRLGTTGSATFDLDWTPPSSNVGNITLYAAGNAANGNTADSGDHIYTTSVTLTPAATVSKPAISASKGVVNAASFQEGIAANGWVTITGTNLAATTRTWTSADIANGKLPTSLDNVSVSINGKAAFVEYISPTQINVIAPDDTATGPVEVRVTVNGQTGDPFAATLQSLSPALFTFDGKYAASTHADNSLLGKTGLFSSAPTATTPAKPGETIVLYATGLGPTSPSIASGQLTDSVAPLTTTPTVTIGGSPASVVFAGLIPPFAQLYQLNVQVPDSLSDGDQPVVIQVGSTSTMATSSCCYITVQK